MAHDRGHHHHEKQVEGVTIVVSCYRGPWNEVLWDRAQPEFYDSLRAAGYSPATADAIGNRICRDQNLVGKPDVMRQEALRIISATPRK